MYSIEERYLMYQKALKDWQIAKWIPLKFRRLTRYGFCVYFQKVLEDLPELYAQKPLIMSNYTFFWFKPGECKPRIATLKAAIKECERQLYKELRS